MSSKSCLIIIALISTISAFEDIDTEFQIIDRVNHHFYDGDHLIFNRTKRQIIRRPINGIRQMYPPVGGMYPGVGAGGMYQPGIGGVYPPGVGAIGGVPGQGCYPMLGPPLNGFPLYACQNQPGFTCAFGCSPGFVVLGSRTVMCNPQTMTWTARPPMCVRNGAYIQRTCSTLDNPVNGIKFGLCNEGSPVGSQCSFTCNPGYMLNGPPLLTCQPDGLWNPMMPPMCIRTAMPAPMPAPVPAPAPRPPTMPGQPVPMPGMPNPMPGMPNPSMTMTTRPPTTMTMTTRPMTTMTGMMTTMRPMGTGMTGGMCPNLVTPMNGMARGVCTMATSGSQCFFSCNPGFILDGRPVLTCMGSMWSSPEPLCRGTVYNPRTGFSALAGGGLPGGVLPGQVLPTNCRNCVPCIRCPRK